MNANTILKFTGLLLLIIGGLNWGLVGLFDFNLVSYIFGDNSFLTRTIYILVGLGALGVTAVLPEMLGVSDSEKYVYCIKH